MSRAVRQRNIRVEYSNRIERLVESLADELDRRRGFDDLFDPPSVIVPNRNVEKFLKFELTDRFGVLGDVAFSTLEAWLRDRLPEEIVPVDEDRLVSAILGILSSSAVEEGDEDWEPVRRYLAGDGTGGEAVRTYQLAERLASNFREYAYSRVEMLEHWRAGDAPTIAEPHYRETEQWQRKLWRRIFGDDGLLERASEGDERFELFTEYWRRADLEARSDELPERVHLFGLSHVAPVYGQIFENLAEVVELHFYVLNPCREFWEDVIYDDEEEVVEAAERETESGDDFLLPLDQRGGEVPDEATLEPASFDAEHATAKPIPLVVWGRAGRDHVHMLNRLTGYDFVPNWVDPVDRPVDGGSPSLLESFQSDVLRFVRADESHHDPEPDESVRFIEAPGVRRELEAVADAIWRFVSSRDDVDFNDVAVVVNPRRREEYQMHLEAVFEEVNGIPFNQVDVERGDGSRLLEAAELLLELPLGDFDRRELGSLLAHPNVAANYREADREEWIRWCRELAIFHGADAEDHEGTHIDRDLYNWDQGVKRLVLGAFLEQRGGDGEGARPFELGDEAYVPEAPFEMAGAGAAGRWIELVRRLIGEAEATRDREDSLGGWLHWMADWIEEHLAPAEPGEEAELVGYLDALRSPAESDLSAVGGERTVPYRTAVEFARRRLAGQTYERGHYLATGVVVSSFVPQRPIPFEAVFMTGLSAEDFPGSSPRTPLDLRTAEWHEGDLWERDRERYMFFETLLSARRRVTCSWVARNPVTGDELEPSSVVREFQHVLQQYVGEEGVASLVREHPLRRFDPGYFDDETTELESTHHPSARAERRSDALRDRLIERTGADRTHEFDARAIVGDADRRAGNELWAERFELVDVPAATDDSDEETRARALPFRALRQFLVSPLQAWARYRLGLRRDDEEAVLEETDEPFELDALEASRILRDGFESAGTAGSTDEARGVVASLRTAFERATLEGRAPVGTFREVAERKLSAVGEAWATQLEAVDPDSLQRFRFGAPAGEDRVEAREAPRLEVERDGDRRRFDLVGDTGLVASGDHGGDVVFVTYRKRKYRIGWRRPLRGWIQGLVLSTAGVFETEAFDVVVLHAEPERSPVRLTFEGNSPETARDHLALLAEQLWFDTHAHRFAISELEAVVDEERRVEPEALRQAVWSADDSSFGGSADEWGPVSNVERFGVPAGGEEKLTKIMKKRLKKFLEAIG